MLEEHEWRPIAALFRQCRRDVRDHIERFGVRMEQVPVDALFEPVREAYFALTGERCDHEHIPAHRVPTLGASCPACRAPVPPGTIQCGLCGAVVKGR